MATSRKKQFERAKPDHPFLQFDDQVVRAVKELGVCTQPQIEAFLGWNKTKAYNHLRNSYDHGYLDKFEVNASAFADPTKTTSLTAGKAPHVYALSKEGIDKLVKEKHAEPGELYLFPHMDARNSTHIAHLVEIRNFRIWLELLSRHYPDHKGSYRWTFEPECHIVLDRKLTVRPDATATYRLKDPMKVPCLLETDRGTEADHDWEKKHLYYASLFNTEYEDGSDLDLISRHRLVVIVPTVARREWLYDVLSNIPEGKQITKPNKIWIAEKSILQKPDLREKVWRVIGAEGLNQFVPDKYI